MRGGERAGGKEPEPQFSNLFDGDKNSLCTFVVRVDEIH